MSGENLYRIIEGFEKSFYRYFNEKFNEIDGNRPTRRLFPSYSLGQRRNCRMAGVSVKMADESVVQG